MSQKLQEISGCQLSSKWWHLQVLDWAVHKSVNNDFIIAVSLKQAKYVEYLNPFIIALAKATGHMW